MKQSWQHSGRQQIDDAANQLQAEVRSVAQYMLYVLSL
jgi:hypothetical protein